MNTFASLEAAVATLVVLWLAAGLLANPLLLGAVALLALLPLGLVVLPVLGVHALGDRTMEVRLLAPVRSAAEPDLADPRRTVPNDD